jgi:hypothetical protein
MRSMVEGAPDAPPTACGGPPPRFAGRDKKVKRLPAYRENFLYLIRCGMTDSMPRRRILSFS